MPAPELSTRPEDANAPESAAAEAPPDPYVVLVDGLRTRYEETGALDDAPFNPAIYDPAAFAALEAPLAAWEGLGLDLTDGSFFGPRGQEGAAAAASEAPAPAVAVAVTTGTVAPAPTLALAVPVPKPPAAVAAAPKVAVRPKLPAKGNGPPGSGGPAGGAANAGRPRPGRKKHAAKVEVEAAKVDGQAARRAAFAAFTEEWGLVLPTDSLMCALDAMYRTQRKRAFVVTAEGDPVGVVSLQGICQMLVAQEDLLKRKEMLRQVKDNRSYL